MTALLNDQLSKPLYTAPPMVPCQISNPSAENWWRKKKHPQTNVAFGVSLLDNSSDRQFWLFSTLLGRQLGHHAHTDSLSGQGPCQELHLELGCWSFLQWCNLLSDVIIMETLRNPTTPISNQYASTQTFSSHEGRERKSNIKKKKSGFTVTVFLFFSLLPFFCLR